MGCHLVCDPLANFKRKYHWGVKNAIYETSLKDALWAYFKPMLANSRRVVVNSAGTSADVAAMASAGAFPQRRRGLRPGARHKARWGESPVEFENRLN